MVRNRPISKKKQKLFDKLENSDIKVGEEIYVKKSSLSSYSKNPDSNELCKIVKIDGDDIFVTNGDSLYKEEKKINKSEIVSRQKFYIGENPFDDKFETTRPVAFTTESILFTLNVIGDRNDREYDINGVPIKELNWNPFVYNKEGKKEYYQRDFVWSLEDKQNLIESIYNGIECGRILVRLRSWKELEDFEKKGEKELAFRDLVDGKQRLNALRGFILEEYPDLHGNYFGDLSSYAQHKLTNHQLFSYAEMPENSTDESVIVQFLKLNFAGVPQSKEHIEHVKAIRNKI